MCTVIVSVRGVLWYVLSLSGTLLVLVSLFTNRWLHGVYSETNLSSPDLMLQSLDEMTDKLLDEPLNALDHHVGLFMKCKVPKGKKLFQGECIPDLDHVESLFTDLDDNNYPHAWRGAVLCLCLGLAIMVDNDNILTDILALATLCVRSCLCCSAFTISGSLQSFAGMLFILGLVAFPAGWGSTVIKHGFCRGQARAFVLGPACHIGAAFWVAVAGTICCCLASYFGICAYNATTSHRCEQRRSEGEKCICLP